MYWYPQISIVFGPHQGSIPLNRWKTLQKSTTNQNTELWSPVQMNTSTKYGTLGKRRWNGHKSQRLRGFAVRLRLPVTSKVISIKSHQHDCPSVRGTRMTPMSTPNWAGKTPEGLIPTKRSIDNWENLGPREPSLRKSTPICCPEPNRQPWKHTFW